MIQGEVRRVGIVGAGIAGLATAKSLLGEGYECVVYERAERLGGVWADGYVDFGVQVQKELYEFPDWPLPAAAPNFTPGPIMQRYLEDYAEHFGVTPCLKLSTRVLSVDPVDGGKGRWRISSSSGTNEEAEDFDFVVIATGLYSETPFIPDYPGRSDFKGSVLHVSDIKTRDPLKDKKVAVIGYGKSATDAAGEAVKVSQEAHLVFRDVHWPVPRKLAGVIPFKWGMLNRLTANLIPPYVRPSWASRFAYGPGRPLPWVFWRLVELLLRVQFRLDTRIEDGETLLPTKPVEIDCFGESTMVPRPSFIEYVRKGRLKAHRSEIERFTDSGILLKNGRRIDCDCVVFGTGWTSDYGYLPGNVRDTLGRDEDGFYLYRHMLHPELANLAFVGRASTFLSIVTYSVQARWLAELLKGRVTLPDPGEMAAEIEALKVWKRSWMPFSSVRSARVLLHMANYHDELLRDFGADPFRKQGFLAPFKEVLAPYQSSDYRDVVAGTGR